MSDLNKLKDELKKAMIEMNPAELSKNFIDGHAYNIKFFTDNNLKKFDSNNEIACEQFVNSLKYKNRKKYYKFDLRQQILLNTDIDNDIKIAKNCYKSYAQGNGSEFNGNPPKASALISSSMLCFNAFSRVNINPITINQVKYNKVYFEFKLPTLRTEENSSYPNNAPANMDAVLISEDNSRILFVESKFTEHLKENHSLEQIVKSNKLGDSYSNDKFYFGQRIGMGKLWKDFIKHNVYEDSGIYANDSSGFDLKQDICHCVGIMNFINRDSICEEVKNKYKSYGLNLSEINKYGFMNLDYEPDIKKHKELHDKYIATKESEIAFGKIIKAGVLKNPDFEYYSYSYKDFANECLPDGEHKDLFMTKYLLKQK